MRILSDLRLLQGSFAALLCVLLTGTVSAALALQYIWGYLPCELCLVERIPYYIGAGLMAVAFIGAFCRIPPKWLAFAFILVALLMLYDVAVSVYHVGVELKYWEGPAGCSSAHLAAVPTEAGLLLDTLNHVHIVPCDQAAGYILGISFAGWNGIAAFIFALLAIFAARYPFACRRKRV